MSAESGLMGEKLVTRKSCIDCGVAEVSLIFQDDLDDLNDLEDLDTYAGSFSALGK